MDKCCGACEFWLKKEDTKTLGWCDPPQAFWDFRDSCAVTRFKNGKHCKLWQKKEPT